MLGDISGVNAIYLICGYTDTRKSIDGLITVIQEQLRMDPRSKALFLFCGKRNDRIKGLLFEGDGFTLLYKRLTSGGRYRWPRNSTEAKKLTWKQFDWLMSGAGDRAAEGDKTATSKIPIILVKYI
ncbi:MAG: IS66 family insertion sequence element accessory protein TnpB [Clostridia bacterium]|nr:IS66 family insertion sequence element accessory protein TnpB [Clostridia bacterium]